MGENTGSGGGAARTSPTAGALGEAGLVPRSCRWCVSGTRVSGRGASGQLAATWGKCGLSAGAEGGRRSASAGAGSPPARPAAAAPPDPAPPSLPPAAAPQRRPPLAPDFSHRPPESSDCPHRRPGTPWAGPSPGSPPTASQSWAGKGILARCCLRAGRQVSAGTGRDTGRDPCPAPTRGPGAPRRMSARAPPGGAGPRESCTAAPLPGPSRVPSCGSQFVPL